jgi:hypothetical protein
MLGPGTYIFPNGSQQHGEYIVVEEELQDDYNQDIGEMEKSRTKQLKIQWISHGGIHPPITIVKKETVIN